MINRLLQLPIRFWRGFISPFLPPSCRFFPSCSAYALEALERHPWPRALRLILWRVLRCNPFHPGGFDPVPPARQPPRGGPPHHDHSEGRSNTD